MYLNIGSNGPVAPTLPGQINENLSTLTSDKANSTERLVEAKNGIVDPLAYYCAFVLIAGMDELLTGGGYCQIGEVRYYELEATIRAWNELEAGTV